MGSEPGGWEVLSFLFNVSSIHSKSFWNLIGGWLGQRLLDWRRGVSERLLSITTEFAQSGQIDFRNYLHYVDGLC